MRCLVTGASGHIGSHLVRRLVAEGYAVTAMVRPASDLWRISDLLNDVELLRADLSNIDSACTSIINAQPDAVFHLAWQGVAAGDERKAAALQSVNVDGSIKLFEIVRDAGCKLWLGLGSQAEYGRSDQVLTEETQTKPATAYGSAKLEVGLKTSELSQQSGMRFVWLRLLATYGPMDDERHLIPHVINQLLQGQTPALTEGKQKWDYLFVDDAVEAILRSAMCNSVVGVFNLGSGESHSISGIVERIRDLIGPSLELGFGQLQYSVDQVMNLSTTIDRMRSATGWSPQVSIDEGLRRTVEWYAAQRA